VTMTSVLGHLTGLEFPPDFKNWQFPPPVRLFDAPVQVKFSDVCWS
jgi:DNA topoisomerase-3